MDLDRTIILHSIKEANMRAFKNYAHLISVFALILGCSIIDIDEATSHLINLIAIKRLKWVNVKLTINFPQTEKYR